MIAFLERTRLRYCYFFLFVAVIFFIFFHLHGLPLGMEGTDDVMFIEQGREASYSELLKYIFVERDPNLLHPCSYMSCLYSRPGFSLLSKMLYLIDGFNENIFYFSRALSVAIICLFIFFFLEQSTKSKTVSMLGALFYATAPPVFSATWLIGDTEIVAHVFLAASIFCLYKILYSNKSEGYSPAYQWDMQKWMYIILFTLFIILAFRTKESAKLIVVILIILLILFYRRFILLLSAPIALFIYYIFPSTGGTESISALFLWHGIYAKFIAASSGGDYSGEVLTLLSPYQHFKQVPISMLSQLGFFLGYFVVFTLLFLLFYKPGAKAIIMGIVRRIKENNLKKEDFILYTSLIWLLVSIPVYGFFTASVENRYFMIGLFPFTFMVFICINKAAIILNIRWRKRYVYLFIFLTLLVIGVNAFHISYNIRGGNIGYHKTNFDTVKFLLSRDQNKTYENRVISYLTFYYISKPDKYYEAVKIDTINKTFINAGINDNGLKILSVFNASVLRENESVYIINPFLNITPVTLNESIYDVTYIAEFGGCFDTTIYCIVKNNFITPKRTHFVWEVRKKETAFSE